MDKLQMLSNMFDKVVKMFLGFLENHELISEKTKKEIEAKINPNKRIFYILLVMVGIYFILSVVNAIFSFPVILIVSVLLGTYISSSK